MSAFDTPKEHVAWAREAINELHSEFLKFFAPRPRPPFVEEREPHGTVVDIDPDTGHHVYKFKILDTLPRALTRKATETLNNIRHSFDQTVYAACVTIGKVPKKGNIVFPWRSNPIDLQRTLEKGTIPSELWDAIKRQEPYPTGNGYTGGNDIVREIAKLANGKHNIGLTITPMIVSVSHPTIISPPGQLSDCYVPNPRWDPVKNEMIIAVVSPGVKIYNNYGIQLDVGFDIPRFSFDEPVIRLLNIFADSADSFVEGIEADCSRIIG